MKNSDMAKIMCDIHSDASRVVDLVKGARGFACGDEIPTIHMNHALDVLLLVMASIEEARLVYADRMNKEDDKWLIS